MVEIAATDIRMRVAIAQCPLLDRLPGTKKKMTGRIQRVAGR
jgi:hypothetical protein